MKIATVSLCVTLAGLLLLNFLLITEKPISITSPENLSAIAGNKPVRTSGIVQEESLASANTRFTLDNGLVLYCTCMRSLKGKSILAEGKVEEFEGRKRIQLTKLIIK